MKRAKTIAATTMMAIIAIIILLPFFVMIMMSTYQTNDLYDGVKLFPGTYALENIKAIFADGHFYMYYLNSIIVAVSTTVLVILVSSLAGFGFSKYRFRFRRGLFLVVLMVMMVPTQLGLVALLIEMKWFHMSDTLFSLIIPAIASPFGVFWMTQFMDASLPLEVIESARIDGATDLRVFFLIAIPYVKPALITLGLLAFLNSWNSYLTPLLLISTESRFTLPLGLSRLNGLYQNNYGAQIMALTIGTLPIIIMFAFGSKYFIKGLVSGAIKG